MHRLLILLACLLPALAADPPAPVPRTQDVIYHRKYGTALTLDVFQPAKPKGVGIIFLISAGWYSEHSAIDSFPVPKQAFLDRGYTVFTVVHGSPPKFILPEIVQDIHRAVRFIRYSAAKFGVNSSSLGITGGSSGCHLALLIATQGGSGNPKAPDPVDRVSSAVQAAACFYPPTDLLNFGRPGVEAVGIGPLGDYREAFGAPALSAEARRQLGRQISPLYFVHRRQPPILLIHGDADPLIPLQQSQIFVDRAVRAGAKAELIVRHGAGHGWGSLGTDVEILANWFDRYLQIVRK
jgi:acetyl esterase/lipase